ncbi:MAG TPA: molybdenum cofactor guanylyltransferase MobA [Comamonadaceae bacterium]|uniref:molybdenum cofactor guanylyltransferase MobA n=1 Tax=Pulveribacter sp. TaxID=2678893 RepID=UPI000EE3C4DB|nr:molybdenum cofactor guanylyltransferase MobA [Pulveribacter sp.]HCL86034.1 molybdenum cofactor guanylyltransferase MobA [Comamonadaceae bacterium]
MIHPRDITALVLAGGRGTRMGGVDKGLQPFHGVPLALHAARRVQPQVGCVMLSANRNLAEYAAWGLPVWPDAEAGFAGPLAGFAAGLSHCSTPWMLTVPCDTPLFPPDLAMRLADAAQRARAPIAMAAAPQATEDGAPRLRTHAVFCLVSVALRADLELFLRTGGRRVQQWSGQHACAFAEFDRPADDPIAFANANTLEQLQELHGQGQDCPHARQPRQ